MSLVEKGGVDLYRDRAVEYSIETSQYHLLRLGSGLRKGVI